MLLNSCIVATNTVLNMSSSNRATRSGSASTDSVSNSVTADEVEKIIQKALSSAILEIKEFFNNKLAELDERVEAAEARITLLEERLLQSDQPLSEPSQPQVINDMSLELQAVKAETRESLMASNDNEQYSRRNNVRICGLKPEGNEECRVAAVKFIRNVLHVPSVGESDIEVAHMTSGFIQSTASQQKRPTMLVRFCHRDARDLVIRSRRILKGTHYAVTEDLTVLNIKTMNRLRNHDQVRTTWSWNGKIFAILSNGKKVTVRPFQPVDELLRS